MISATIPISSFPSIGYAMSAPRNERMPLPVAPANYLYSHFKHVFGVPAPEGSRGVAVNKLKILDVLIEHLNQRKKQPTVDIESSSSESRIDALIEHYRSQIRQTKAVNMAMPYVSHAAIPTGVLFDLVA